MLCYTTERCVKPLDIKFCLCIFIAEENGRFKTMCCVPVFLIVLFVLGCAVTGITLLCIHAAREIREPEYADESSALANKSGAHPDESGTLTVESGILIGIAIIIGVALIGNCYTWARMLVNIVISPRRRINMIANKIDSISGMETVIQVSCTQVFILQLAVLHREDQDINDNVRTGLFFIRQGKTKRNTRNLKTRHIYCN